MNLLVVRLGGKTMAEKLNTQQVVELAASTGRKLDEAAARLIIDTAGLICTANGSCTGSDINEAIIKIVLFVVPSAT